MTDPGQGPLLSPAVKQALVIGATLGVVAALTVWWLERFELNRLHADVRHYLENHDAFRDWQRQQGNGKGET